MGLIFSTNFENGSLIELVSGNVITLSTNSKIHKTSKGFSMGIPLFSGMIAENSTEFTTGYDLSIFNKFTVVYYGWGSKINAAANAGFSIGGNSTFYQTITLLNDRSSNSGLVYFYVGVNNIQQFDDNSENSFKPIFIGILFDGTGATNADKFKVFKNGTWRTITFSGTLPTNPCSGSKIKLNGTYFNGNNSYGQTLKLAIWNSLEPNEIDKYYQDFLNSKPSFKPVTNFYFFPKTADNKNGLVAEYNFVNTTNNIVVNEAPSSSANGNNSSQYNLTLPLIKRVDSAYLHTSKLISQYSDLGTVYSLCFYLKANVPATWFLVHSAYGNNRLSFNSTSITEYGHGNALVSIGNVYLNSDVKLNLTSAYNSIIIIRTIDNKIYIYYNGILSSISQATDTNILRYNFFNYFGNGKYFLKNFRIYNKEISQQEIYDYHNFYTSQPSLLEDFSQYPVGSFPSPNWRKTTGTLTIQELNTDDNIINIIKGQKYIGWGGINGDIRIVSKVAYGTWQFVFRYISAGTGPVAFINNTQLGNSNGWTIYFEANGRINLIKQGIGFPVQTAIGYLTNNTLYEFKITRDYNGKFTLYIRGGSFGNSFILVSTAGGTGTNPYVDNTTTTCNDFYLYGIAANNLFTNIQIYPGIVV